MGKRSRANKYTREFKTEAVRMSENSDKSVPKVAKELGIPKYTLYRWIDQYQENPATAFPGSGKRRAGTPEEEEIYRLRKQVADLTQERDILKKVFAIFSKEPQQNEGS